MSDERCRCAGIVKATGKRCSRTVGDGEQYCHLHMRQRKAAVEKAKQKAKVVEFPLKEGVERRKHDPEELLAWLAEVRNGERYYTAQKVTGGDGEPVDVDVYPNWNERLKAAELEFRVGNATNSEQDDSKEALREAFADMLGL